MPPAPVTKASRRSRHVIESSSESSATPPILARPTRATKAAKSYAEDDEDDDVEDEDDGPQEKDVDREGEKDAEGEDEDGEDEGGVEKDMEIDGLESEEEAGYKRRCLPYRLEESSASQSSDKTYEEIMR